MVDSLSKIIGVFVAVLLLFIYPISHMAENQEESMRLWVLSATTTLVDSIRDKGYVDADMYESFLDEISMTKCSYEVNMEHKHKIYYPIYTDINDPDSFTGEYEVIYEGFFTEEILGDIEGGGRYYFSKDDYLTLEVLNTSKSLAMQIRSFVFGDQLKAPAIYVKYGGRIRYENY